MLLQQVVVLAIHLGKCHYLDNVVHLGGRVLIRHLQRQ